ncbi:hypothetical protein LR948_15845 [Roseivivax sp. GX 12232]|uniref:hypothetical protein n=1 Tax=Roseivivax sp. GX 12232 TaxID=2900547 RepID=UPI001E552A31|nr:hypothetical protein [Roseivivax sp. GX 12232]MCE0506844.1 hypothetical protein [Roseivivax sp. GX 12232]
MRTALLSAACLMAVTPAAFAQEADAECDLQAEIVMQVVEARQSGSARDSAQAGIASDLSGDAQKYAAVVPAIAEWVYSLPEDQLGADVGESWIAQCQSM